MHLPNTDGQLGKNRKVLVMYNETKLRTRGKCKVKMPETPVTKKLHRLEFQVVDQKDRIPLLGRRASETTQFIKVQYESILTIDIIVIKEENTSTKECNRSKQVALATEFEHIFTGDECLEGEYKAPVKLPKCRVPVAMMAPPEEKQKNLEERRIIIPTEKSTEVHW